MNVRKNTDFQKNMAQSLDFLLLIVEDIIKILAYPKKIYDIFALKIALPVLFFTVYSRGIFSDG